MLKVKNKKFEACYKTRQTKTISDIEKSSVATKKQKHKKSRKKLNSKNN